METDDQRYLEEVTAAAAIETKKVIDKQKELGGLEKQARKQDDEPSKEFEEKPPATISGSTKFEKPVRSVSKKK